MKIKVLTIDDLNLILEREREFLNRTLDENDAKFAEWTSRWREEALSHYLNLGWSFGLFDPQSENFLGYFIGQVYLFHRGNTQTLWVENISEWSDVEVKHKLIDTAVRVAREKHLQRALFPPNPDEIFIGQKVINKTDEFVEIQTAKG